MSKITEKICMHCGEVVNEDVDICPSCGLPVSAIDNDVESSTNKEVKPKKSESEKAYKERKAKDKSKFIIIAGLVILLLAAVIIAVVSTKKVPTVEDSKTKGIVTTKDELKKRFDVDIKEPEAADDLHYMMESNTIAKMTYKKTVSDGNVMDFVLRVASSTEDIENSIGLTDSKGEDIEFAYTPIMMTVICEDGSEVPVESKVALDENNQEMRYMRALWYDNDKYYSMVTDNLVTREDFLQEVNRVIIANHESF